MGIIFVHHDHCRPCFPVISTFLLPPLPRPLQEGWLPLHAAAARGRVSVIALLLATPGVDPLAVWVRITQELIRARLPAPCPFLLMQSGMTPLDIAKIYGETAAAALLQADPRVAGKGRRA